MVKRKNDRDACNKAKKRMREYRERIKNDPERYELMKQMERERYKKRVESGKIKTA